MNVQVYFFLTNCFVLFNIIKTIEKNFTFPSNHLLDWKSYEIDAIMITIATLLFIMNDKRKCLFLAELEVMFFSLPITFKYNLLYS